MPRSAVAALLNEFRAHYCAGAFTDLLSLRAKLTAAMADVADLEIDEQLELRADLAYIELMLLDRTAALSCLSHFVIGAKEPLRRNTRAISLARRARPRVLGLVVAQLSHLFYRAGAFEEAEITAREALSLLALHRSDDLFGFLMLAQTEILWARIAYRIGWRFEAEDQLRRTVEMLTSRFRASDQTRGVDVLLAHAHGLWAAFGWSEGRFEDARRHVYQALFLLRDTRSDELGFAYALYTAGRIEAGYSHHGLQLSFGLLHDSEQLFRKHHHPFLLRVLVQIAQTQIKDGSSVGAEQTLAKLKDRSIAAESRERQLAAGDELLCRIWLLEAQGDDTATRLACHKACKDLLAMSDLPSRLGVMEAQLHYGIALIRDHGRRFGNRVEGRKRVEAALESAAREGRTTMQTRAYFALAQSYLDEDRPKAAEWFRQGQRLLATHPSNYLNALRDRLATQIEAPFVMELALRLPLKQAEREFRRRYLEYHLASGMSKEQLAHDMRTARSTVFNILKKK